MLTLEIKSKIVAEAERHERLDGAMFAKGSYEKKNGMVKHCSIGCVRAALGLNASLGEHGKLCDPTGVPEFVLLMSDHVFENLPDELSKTWTRRLWDAIPAGVDIAPAAAEISSRLMLDPEIGLAHVAILESVRLAAQKIGELYRLRAQGHDPANGDWYAARQQADAAVRQADAARRQAYADAAWSQAYAARSQAYAARSQAYAARQRFWIRVSEVMIEVMYDLALSS